MSIGIDAATGNPQPKRKYCRRPHQNTHDEHQHQHPHQSVKRCVQRRAHLTSAVNEAKVLRPRLRRGSKAPQQSSGINSAGADTPSPPHPYQHVSFCSPSHNTDRILPAEDIRETSPTQPPSRVCSRQGRHILHATIYVLSSQSTRFECVCASLESKTPASKSLPPTDPLSQINIYIYHKTTILLTWCRTKEDVN